MEKMQANPKALETLQKNPILAQQIANEPKLLLDLLDGKEIKPKKIEMSPANKSLINRAKSGANTDLNNNTEKPGLKTSTDLFSNKKPQQTETTKVRDTATYIPSSEFKPVTKEKNEEEDLRLNLTLEKAERAMKNAEKLL